MRQGTVIAIKTNFMMGKLIGFRIKGAQQFGGKVVDIPGADARGIKQSTRCNRQLNIE